jgi:hypothetical protein
VNIEHIAPGLTRVQSLDPEDDDTGGLVLKVTPSGGILVRWDGGADVWTTADHLCREGDRPEAEEPSEREIERDHQRRVERMAGG